jgi:hypothetical protein
MRFGDRCKGYVVHESVAMLIEGIESRDKLSRVGHLIWIEKVDDISGGDASDTRMRRRAVSKLRVRVGVEDHDESI